MGVSFANVEECSVCEMSEKNKIGILIICITFFLCPVCALVQCALGSKNGNKLLLCFLFTP